MIVNPSHRIWFFCWRS